MSKEKHSSAEENMEELENVLVESEHFLEKNAKPLTIGFIALVILALGVLGFQKLIQEPNETKANAESFKAILASEQNDAVKALEGDVENVGLLDIIDNYSSTKAGNIAKLHAAAKYRDQGEYAKAIELYKQFSTDDPVLESIKIGSIGDCESQLGNIDAAIKNYEKAAAIENGSTAPYYLLKAGLHYEAAENIEKANEAYSKIKSDYKNSPLAMDIDKYIARTK